MTSRGDQGGFRPHEDPIGRLKSEDSPARSPVIHRVIEHWKKLQLDELLDAMGHTDVISMQERTNLLLDVERNRREEFTPDELERLQETRIQYQKGVLHHGD